MNLLKLLAGVLFLLDKGDGLDGDSQSQDDDDLEDVLDELGGDDGDSKDDKTKSEKGKKEPDVSKIVSKRINEERVKLAKELGFNSYEELKTFQKEQKATHLKRKIEEETTLDYEDEEVKKVVKLAREHDPAREELEEELKQLREEKAVLWEKEQLIALKTEYPELAKLKGLSELDEKTLGFIEKGILPIDAYFAANRDKILKKGGKADDKEHLKGSKSGGSTSDDKTTTVTPEVLAIHRELNPNLTDEEIIERVAKLNKTK